MKRRLRRPSPALVISLVALFVALGGTTYAATSLPKNSVGTKQLRKNAVTASKLKKGAVTAAKINTTGLAVPIAKNADSATYADLATDAADLGGHPASYYSVATLQSGQSESGVFGLGGPSPGAGYYYTAGTTFQTPLTHALDANHVVVVAQGASPQPHCAGEGHADPGYLCVYDGVTIDMTMPGGSISLPDSQNAGAAPEGFVLSAGTTTATGAAAVYGTWTVSGG